MTNVPRNIKVAVRDVNADKCALTGFLLRQRSRFDEGFLRLLTRPPIQPIPVHDRADFTEYGHIVFDEPTLR